MELTQLYLKSLFHYDQNTGIFTRSTDRGNRARAGSVAGTLAPDGYCKINLDGRIMRAHRLAFLYMGYPMPSEVDHINGIRHDNRWENLRAVTRQENNRNRRKVGNNTSGVTGVYMHTKNRKWVAQICISRNVTVVGYSDDWFEAVCARKSAENKYGFHANHGRIL